MTLIYETAGIHLTVLGKALDNGTEGDIVNVLNLQSKRTVSGVVVGRGRVATVVAPRPEVAVAQPKLQDKLQDKLSDSTSLGAAQRPAAISLPMPARKSRPNPE
ncbi:MAG: flagella basal body P-ring formation protein FlgA [Gammaproteobacteria bacterium]